MRTIYVNPALWNAVTSEQQQIILSGLRRSGALGPEDVISSDTDAPRGDGPCEAACTAAYDAACIECAALPPQAAAICYGVAATAYGACLLACATQ